MSFVSDGMSETVKSIARTIMVIAVLLVVVLVLAVLQAWRAEKLREDAFQKGFRAGVMAWQSQHQGGQDK